MMPTEWYIVYDINEFVDSARALVFKCFGNTNGSGESDIFADLLSGLSSDELTELNNTLSHEESASIVKQRVRKQVNKNTKQERYAINDVILMQIIEELNSRMVSNILNKLVNQGVLESAYDDESNDFIFWIKEDHDQNNQAKSEKPETD